MASIDIIKNNPQRNKNAIFISAGDRETFATYALKHFSKDFDIYIFYYGDGNRTFLCEQVTFYATGKGTKFSTLKKIMDLYPDRFSQYDSVWVCDDDIQPVDGDIALLTTIISEFGLKVLSPAHSPLGRISHTIMLPDSGTELFRYVNFVECTAPMFSSKALLEYMQFFDASLDGWGTDWWYMNVFEANIKPVAAIVDSVVIINPLESEKEGGYREIERVASNESRKTQWINAMKKYGLKEWEHKNLIYSFPIEEAKNQNRLSKFFDKIFNKVTQ
jgi:hypothetical protein